MIIGRIELLTILLLLKKTYAVHFKSKKKHRFLSLEMMWLENSLIREFVLSARIAKICAQLLDVKKIRLYHDNALVKESGCGRTPWHFDDHHFPLATNNSSLIISLAITDPPGLLILKTIALVFSFTCADMICFTTPFAPATPCAISPFIIAPSTVITAI